MLQALIAVAKHRHDGDRQAFEHNWTYLALWYRNLSRVCNMINLLGDVDLQAMQTGFQLRLHTVSKVLLSAPRTRQQHCQVPTYGAISLT